MNARDLASGPAKSGGSYRELKALPARADRMYYQDAVTCTVWSNGAFWSYDCPEALRAKMAYIKRHHLGGVMFWDLSHDTENLELLHILNAGK